MPPPHIHNGVRDKSPNRQNAPHRGRNRSHLSDLQKHVIAASGEFVGTFLFLYFAFACQVMLATQASEFPRNGGKSSQRNVFTALVYGLSLLVNTWAFFRISGGLFNPAATFGMCLAGVLTWTRAAFLIPAQLLAGMSAGGLVSCMFPGGITNANTTLGPGTSIAQGVFIEMFMTSELVFVGLMLGCEKSKSSFIVPAGIGLALFVAMLGGVNNTGGSLNPTRSFGPAVAGPSFPGYHWIYWVGPCLGAALAAGYYRFVRYFNHEETDPGQHSANGDYVHD